MINLKRNISHIFRKWKRTNNFLHRHINISQYGDEIEFDVYYEIGRKWRNYGLSDNDIDRYYNRHCYFYWCRSGEIDEYGLKELMFFLKKFNKEEMAELERCSQI